MQFIQVDSVIRILQFSVEILGNCDHFPVFLILSAVLIMHQGIITECRCIFKQQIFKLFKRALKSKVKVKLWQVKVLSMVTGQPTAHAIVTIITMRRPKAAGLKFETNL